MVLRDVVGRSGEGKSGLEEKRGEIEEDCNAFEIGIDVMEHGLKI